MSEEHYYIRQEEWQEMRGDLKEIKEAVTRFLEREKASEAAIIRAQDTADNAQRDATEALTRIALVEQVTESNTGNWSDLKGLAFKIAAGLIGAGISGAIGYLVAT